MHPYTKISERIISTRCFFVLSLFFFFVLELSEIWHLFGVQKALSDRGQYGTSSILTTKLISVTKFGGTCFACPHGRIPQLLFDVSACSQTHTGSQIPVFSLRLLSGLCISTKLELHENKVCTRFITSRTPLPFSDFHPSLPVLKLFHT